MSQGLVQLAYLIATALFVFALHWMNTPATARRGVYAGVIGMTLAVAATWAEPEVVHHLWIVIAVIAGFAVGIPLSRVPLTAVPQRTALSHAFGGLAAGLVGTAKFYLWTGQGSDQLTAFRTTASTCARSTRWACTGLSTICSVEWAWQPRYHLASPSRRANRLTDAWSPWRSASPASHLW
jgi:NAD/NADP transhydrogenase beta subunit